MKKKVLFFLFVFMSFFIFNTKAYALDMKISDVSIIDKSSSVTGDITSHNDSTIENNIIFSKVDDYVLFNISIKNNEDYKYTIESIKNVYDNEYIVITSESDKLEIDKNSTFNLKVKAIYNKKLINKLEESIDNVLIKVKLVREDGKKEEIIINPITGDNLFKYLILLILSISVLILTRLLLIKGKKIYGILMIFLLVISVPFIILAEEKYELDIYINGITYKGELLTYNITLDTNGGSEVDNFTRKYGEKLGELPRPTKEGYDFDKWVDENNEPADKDYLIKSDKNYTAIYNSIVYNISYDLDGGTVTGNPNTYTIETDTFTLKNPKKTNYTFVGWKENDVTKPVITIEKGSTGDRNLKAIYEEFDLDFINQTIEVTYSNDEQRSNIVSPTNGSGNYSYIEISEESSSSEETNYISIDNDKVIISGNTPVGGYAVTIKANDEETGNYSEAIYQVIVNPKASSVTLSENSINIKHGETGTNTFTYDGDGEVVCESSSNKVTCTVDNENKTITVTGEEVGTYRITVKGINGTNYSDTEEKTFTVNIVDEDGPINTAISSTNNLDESQTVSLTCEDDVAVSAYYFGLDEPNENTDYITVRDVKVMNTVNVISTEGKYYFVCKDSSGNIGEVVEKSFYKTTLVVENGTVNPNKILTMEGNKFNLPTPTAIDKYEPIGSYYTNSSLTDGKIDYEEEYEPIISNVLYTSTKKAYYIVTYDYLSNAGTGVSKLSEEVKVGNNVDLTVTATKIDEVFVGWNTNKDATDVLSEYIMPENDVTLYAIFGRATFMDGYSFNTKIKNMLDYPAHSYGEEYYYLVEENQITSFKQSLTIPDEVKNDEHLVSSSDSLVPIYAWFDNGTLYWYSNDSKPYLNEHTDVMFASFTTLTDIDTDKFDTSRVKYMSYMFSRCYSLEEIDLSSWDTSSLVNTTGLFSRCTSLKELDLTAWDTSKVTAMGNMFSNCTSLTSLNISTFNTSNVTDMNEMFFYASSLETLNVSSFNTSNVYFMTHMFAGCESLKELDVSNFDTSKIDSLDGMFYGCKSLKVLDLRSFDTREVESMAGTFKDCDNLELIIMTSFETPKLRDLDDYSRGHATAGYALLDDNNDYQDDHIFAGTFRNSPKLSRIVVSDKWVTTLFQSNDYPFNENTSLVGEKGTAYVQGNNRTTYAHIDGGVQNPGYFYGPYGEFIIGETFNDTIKDLAESYSNIKHISYSNTKDDSAVIVSTDLSPVPIYAWFDTDTIYLYCEGNTLFLNEDSTKMFNNLTNLESIDLSRMNTRLVKNFSYMFNNTHISSLDLRSFDTGNATNMSGMFKGFEANTLNLSSFNTSKVTDISNMFASSKIKNSLDLSHFNVENITNSYGIFNQVKFDNTLDIHGWHLGNSSNNSIDVNAATISNLVMNNVKVENKSLGLSAMASNIGTFNLNSADFSAATSGNSTFGAATIGSLNMEHVNLSNITGDLKMFQDSHIGDLDIDYLNINKITRINNMFGNSSPTVNFDIDFSKVYMSNIKDMSNMFSDHTINGNITFDGSNFYYLENISNMFVHATANNVIINNLKTSNIKNASMIFSTATIGSVDFTNLDLSHATSVDKMFTASTIGTLNFKNIKFGEVSLEYLFTSSKITNLNIENINTSIVTSMKGMFANTSGFNSVDISSFTTSNVTDMSGMFTSCMTTTIYAGDKFDTSNLETSSGMFAAATNLVGGAGTTYDNAHVDATYAHVDGGVDNPGYFTIGTTAEFNSGYIVNNIFKSLAGDKSNIKYIAYSNTDNSSAVDISSGASGSRINAWFDTDTIYLYSNTNILYLNSDSSGLFSGLTNLENIDFSRMNSSRVTNMIGFFSGSKVSSNIDLSSLDTSNVTTATAMFNDANIYISDINDLNLSKLTEASAMFAGATFNNDFSVTNKNFGNATINSMFVRTTINGTLDLSNNTYGVGLANLLSQSTVNKVIFNDVTFKSNVNDIFTNSRIDEIEMKNVTCGNNVSNFTSIFTAVTGSKVVIDNFSCPRVNSFKFLFSRATFSEITMTNINTPLLNNISYMFQGSGSGSNPFIDISGLDTTNVTNASYMFNDANAKTIYVGDNFNTSNITNSVSMFDGCQYVVGGNGTTFDPEHIDKEYARVDSLDSPGYFTYKAPDTGASISKLIRNNSIKHGALILGILLVILSIVYIIYVKKKRK